MPEIEQTKPSVTENRQKHPKAEKRNNVRGKTNKGKVKKTQSFQDTFEQLEKFTSLNEIQDDNYLTGIIDSIGATASADSPVDQIQDRQV